MSEYIWNKNGEYGYACNIDGSMLFVNIIKRLNKWNYRIFHNDIGIADSITSEYIYTLDEAKAEAIKHYESLQEQKTLCEITERQERLEFLQYKNKELIMKNQTKLSNILNAIHSKITDGINAEPKDDYEYLDLSTANNLFLDSSMFNEWLSDIAEKRDLIEYVPEIWNKTERENKQQISETVDVINDLLSVLINELSSKYYENFIDHDYHERFIDGCELCEIESSL